jgi:hypothetical protein
LSNKKYRLPNTMRRCQALSADGLRLIIWRDIIFFLCSENHSSFWLSFLAQCHNMWFSDSFGDADGALEKTSGSCITL